MTKIIGIVSAKGGVGKTAVTANLGVALVKQGRQVVVIDGNLTNPHLGLLLGLPQAWPSTLNDVLKGRIRMEKALVSHPSGVQIVPAAFEPRDLRSLPLCRLRSRMRETFAKRDVDFVLLDSSPGLSAEGVLALKLADEVYFVATPHLPAVIDIAKARRLLNRGDAKPSGVILNRVRNKPYELSDAEIEHFTRLPIIGRIPEDEAVLKAVNFKVPVVTAEPRAKASLAFEDLAIRITHPKAARRVQKRSFWSFFGR